MTTGLQSIDVPLVREVAVDAVDISRHLFLSEKTVKAHLAAVFRKLNVTNRTQAAMAAVTMGMGPGRIAKVAE